MQIERSLITLIHHEGDCGGELLIEEDALYPGIFVRCQFTSLARRQFDSEEMEVLVAAGVLQIEEVVIVVGPIILADATFGIARDLAGIVLVAGTHPNLEDVLIIGGQVGKVLTIGGDLCAGPFGVAEEDITGNEGRLLVVRQADCGHQGDTQDCQEKEQGSQDILLHERVTFVIGVTGRSWAQWYSLSRKCTGRWSSLFRRKKGMLHPVQDWLKARLQPPYLRLIAGAVVLMGLTLAIVSWTTSNRGTSAVGIPWGADFAGFYVAAQILDQGDAGKLYDRDVHARLYHELLPNLPKEEIIPYVHPPFVAGTLRLLTGFSYDTAVAIWLVISMGLYVAGVLLILKTCPLLDQQHRWLVVLLAVSFEPFLFECWLGGQLSAVAFFSYALAWYCYRRGWPIYAGLALGICFYKPTLLILILPMLLLARQWKVLLGMTVTGLFLLGTSLLMVGWESTVSYLDVLLAFRQATAGQEEMVIRTWKYVDFNHFYLQLFRPSIWKTVAFIITVLLCVGWMLVRLWWRWSKYAENWEVTWACTLFLVPLINVYVGVYDSILAVQAAIIVTEVLLRQANGKLLKTGWPYCLLMLALVPWFSQPVAKSVGVQLYSVVLLACGMYVSRATEWRNVNSRG